MKYQYSLPQISHPSKIELEKLESLQDLRAKPAFLTNKRSIDSDSGRIQRPVDHMTVLKLSKEK